jgi:hypothetical protein
MPLNDFLNLFLFSSYFHRRGTKSTQGGNRTRTGVASDRILSPACLPIPPLEPKIENKKLKKS